MTETFYHVYELPARSDLSSGYCFGGGNPIPFLNVDWFGGTYQPLNGGGPVSASRDDIEKMVRGKRYIKPDRRYLVLGSPGHTFVLEPSAPSGEQRHD